MREGEMNRSGGEERKRQGDKKEEREGADGEGGGRGKYSSGRKINNLHR